MSAEFVPPPGRGRRYVSSRRVHLGDVDGSARLRLVGLACYLQDVATDDADDAGLRGGGVWVVRRVAVAVRQLPMFHDHVDLVTFCSGTGARWAERRTTLTGENGARVEAVAIWVLIDGVRGRPLPLGEDFFAVYGEAAGDRKVSSRLGHRHPPPDAPMRPWPLRESDFDVLDHVNNVRYWEAVEDELLLRLPDRPVVRAEVEYRGAVERGDELGLVSEVRNGTHEGSDLAVWLVSGGEVRMSALVVAGARREPTA